MQDEIKDVEDTKIITISLQTKPEGFVCLYLTDTMFGEKALDYFRFTRRTTVKDLKNFISSKLLPFTVYKSDVVGLMYQKLTFTPEQFITSYDVFADIGVKVTVAFKTQQMTNTHVLNLVDEKKRDLDDGKIHPMSNDKSMELWNRFQIDLIYSNVSLEGNTFTREETEMLLLGTLTNTHSDRETQEVKNSSEAVTFLSGILKEKFLENILTISEIDENKICDIHRILMKNIEGIQPGGYRNVEIMVKGSKTVFPKNEKEIREKMKEIVTFIRNGPQKMHVLEFSNLVHLKFVTIHPFKDGNGRTARILMSLIHILYGYPFCVISPTIRILYLGSVHTFQQNGDLNLSNRICFESVSHHLDLISKLFQNKNRFRILVRMLLERHKIRY